MNEPTIFNLGCFIENLNHDMYFYDNLIFLFIIIRNVKILWQPWYKQKNLSTMFCFKSVLWLYLSFITSFWNVLLSGANFLFAQCSHSNFR